MVAAGYLVSLGSYRLVNLVLESDYVEMTEAREDDRRIGDTEIGRGDIARKSDVVSLRKLDRWAVSRERRSERANLVMAHRLARVELGAGTHPRYRRGWLLTPRYWEERDHQRILILSCDTLA